MLKYKNTDLEIKDVDDSKGIVIGYFSAFDNIDSDGDVIVKGAFTKTIEENGPGSKKDRIQHLLQHNTSQPIGKLQSLGEDDKGLRFESKMSKSTLGQDTLQLYKEGILREHSIGFETIKEEPTTWEGHECNKISEMKLWEGSTVTFGANPNTPVEEIKNKFKGTALYDLLVKDLEGWSKGRIVEELKILEKLFSKGTVSDEMFVSLELRFKQLQNAVNSLLTQKPLKSTPADLKKPSKLLKELEGFRI